MTSFSVDLLPDTDGVQISWLAPDNLTVAVLGYVLTYRVIGIGDCNTTYSTPPTTLPQLPDVVGTFSLTDLTPWTKYRISLAAVNIAGSGQKSYIDVIMRGSGTPSATAVVKVYTKTRPPSRRHLRRRSRKFI